ncbi:MAG TPA: methyltransferase domain-containing protein [Chthoniobacterales bacterium]|nr:methyltransferase domain-containing protein [Chthoniobacterales bacterium]
MVNSAIAENKPVLTFACGAAPALAAREGLRVHRRLASRRPGLTCPLHHFVDAAEAAEILARTPPGTLTAFDEASYFNQGLVPAWQEASQRGVEVLISTPSSEQLEALGTEAFTETVFAMKCEDCGNADASTFIVSPETDRTVALCSACERARTAAARADVLERLERQPPHPGEKSIYQPVDQLAECADWNVIRPDSRARVDLMLQIMREAGLPESVAPDPATYLDIGCNTGYFCDRIRQAGFYAEGVDLMEGDIAVAKILDAFIRKRHNHFIAQDAYSYLEQTQERRFDVTSAFAVFQWLMIQTTVERGLTCLEWLFAKTKRLCFLEMGYSVEPQYRERLKVSIDREWVRRIMEEKGGFAEVRVLEGKDYGFMFGRDLFVGIKEAPSHSAARALS